MKIAVFTLHLNRTGGIERVVDFYLNELATMKNCEVHCFAADIAPDVLQDYEGRVTFHSVHIPLIGPFLMHWIFFIRASFIIRNSDFDAYYAHFPLISFGKRFVYHVHSVHKEVISVLERRKGIVGALRYVVRRFYPLPILFEYLAFRDPKRKTFIAVSPKIQHEIVRHYRVPEERILIVANPIPLDEFQAERRDAWRDELRAQYDFLNTPGAVWLGTVANRLSGKNVDLIIRALAQLERDDLHLIIVGDLKLANVELLHEWMRDRKLETRVHFVGRQENIAHWYAAFDFSVFPSAYESFGLSVAESLLMGTPSITTNGVGFIGFLTTGAKQELLRIVRDISDERELAGILNNLPRSDAVPRVDASRIRGLVAELNAAGKMQLATALGIR